MRAGTALKLLIDVVAWGFLAALLAFALRLELVGKDYFRDALTYAAVVLPLKAYAMPLEKSIRRRWRSRSTPCRLRITG